MLFACSAHYLCPDTLFLEGVWAQNSCRLKVWLTFREPETMSLTFSVSGNVVPGRVPHTLCSRKLLLYRRAPISRTHKYNSEKPCAQKRTRIIYSGKRLLVRRWRFSQWGPLQGKSRGGESERGRMGNHLEVGPKSVGPCFVYFLCFLEVQKTGAKKGGDKSRFGEPKCLPRVLKSHHKS